MSKPIDLIIANTMHDVVAQLGEANDMLRLIGHKGKPVEMDCAGQEAIARKLLCNIAHQAALSKVFAALKAIGAPHSHDDINEGFRAVTESRE